MQAPLPPLASPLRVRVPVKEGEDEIGISLSQAAARAAAAISRATSRAVHPPKLVNAEVRLRFICSECPANCSLSPSQTWILCGACQGVLLLCQHPAPLLTRNCIALQAAGQIESACEAMALSRRDAGSADGCQPPGRVAQESDSEDRCAVPVGCQLSACHFPLPIASSNGLHPAGQPLRSDVLQPEASHPSAMKSLV